jgi:ABC-type uncharacterized transport system auxiliary subunit
MRRILIWSDNMKTKIIPLLIIVSLIVSSCSKRITTRRYYLLEIPTTEQRPKPTKSEFSARVDVRDFHVSRAFDQTRIALRTNTNELDYYFYHHWASKPSRIIADYIYELVENRNVFSVLSRSISYNPDYIIRGDVKSLERIQKDKKAFAHVRILIELINPKTGEVLAQFEDDQRLPLEPANNMNTFARATSQIFRHVTDEFLERVRVYLNEHAETLE